MVKLFLDDIRIPRQSYDYTHNLIYTEKDWIIVRTFKEFMSYLSEHGLPDLISFDHDLADEHYRPSMYNPDEHYSNYYTDGTFKEKTGYCCAKALIDYCIDNDKDVPKFLVHSMNPVGKKNITSILENYQKFRKKS
jgi:hypothetical protein